MSAISREKILSSAQSLVEFVNRCPSPYHVVHTCRKMLKDAGFVELSEKSSWDLNRGKKYFCTKNQSMLVAFAVGEKYEAGNGFSIIGAHTDSPCLKVKPVSKKESCKFLQVGVQCYGGGIWNTWFDRDLTVAGRAIVKCGDKYEHRLVNVSKPILRIPHLCIHLQREMNDKFVFNKETHLLPILATEEFNQPANESDSKKKESPEEEDKHHSALIDLLCNELCCKPGDLLDFELALADTQPATVGGAHDEFIFAPRLDNLFNTYCALQALINCTHADGLSNEKNVRFVSLFDNEEVGSESAQGACSLLTESIIRRICQNFESNFEQVIANSYLLSADQAHAVHPNYAEKHENSHKPRFHGGPVLKFNANQRYATTAVTASIMRIIAADCGVPLQDVVVRNDSACGSTIGPILSARLGIRTADIGGPQLSMHSIRETCCTSSVEQSIVLFGAFFQKFPLVDASIMNA
ncbi:aspartyl aminopeptidase-like [Hydractinia symbiolongicarpus]|uniref:aspartyl aminopeptidase-like n=1 Tax=Hydractinia symbiolongicarpus TaxID=13093 RepID=UPI00254C5882|nr:aspartyl aminopeptidase-like [Hydractinia symbiolongicarpus]